MTKSRSDSWWLYNEQEWGEGDDPVADKLVLINEENILKLQKDLWDQRFGSTKPFPSDDELINNFVVYNWCWRPKAIDIGKD